VTTLVQESLPAGSYSTEFNAGSLESGMYFCRIRTGQETKNLKLLIE
jgi:hypothetical protein